MPTLLLYSDDQDMRPNSSSICPGWHLWIAYFDATFVMFSVFLLRVLQIAFVWVLIERRYHSSHFLVRKPT